MTFEDVVILTRSDVAALLSLDDCIAAVEQALRLHQEGRTLPPGALGIHAHDGGFHIKAAGLKLDRTYFVTKVNGNFFHNQERFGLPRIQGVVVLCDGDNGRPLALMDSTEITALRTGAATAVAAKYLARRDTKVVTVCGCGRQGHVQLRSLARVLRLKRIFAYDTDPDQARRFVHEISNESKIAAEAVEDLPTAVGQSDVCVTCTPSRSFYLQRAWVRPGTFVAAVGADSSEKQELDVAFFSRTKVVVDHLEQCAAIGDLHHALSAGMVTRGDVHAELCEVVAGAKPGRTSDDEITVFDSTGIALEDAAAAAAVFEKAQHQTRGIRVKLFD